MQPSGLTPPSKFPLLLLAIVSTAAFAVGSVGGYAMYEHRQAVAATQQQQQLADQLKQTRAQLDDLSNQVSTLASRPEPQPVVISPTPEPAPVAKVAARRAPGDNQHLKKLQSQVDKQGEAIDEQSKAIASTQNQLDTTRTDLTNTRTELSGSIATNHDELVLLQKKGERNYYEFDIAKSKEFSHEGPMGVRLRKANTKHQYADLDLTVEDQTVTQKHVNLYQPAMFYLPNSPLPAELVINSITKDRIHGYVSSPKYRRSELASNSASTATQQAADSPQAQRQTLPPPK
jgi:hypothetical protein